MIGARTSRDVSDSRAPSHPMRVPARRLTYGPNAESGASAWTNENETGHPPVIGDGPESDMVDRNEVV